MQENQPIEHTYCKLQLTRMHMRLNDIERQLSTKGKDAEFQETLLALTRNFLKESDCIKGERIPMPAEASRAWPEAPRQSPTIVGGKSID